MKRHVAFLRGINLGRRRPPMHQLKTLFEALRFEAVETFIASGNVIFSSTITNQTRLEQMIADQLEASLGYDVDTFVRTARAVVAVSQARVFPEEGQEGIVVQVGFLHEELSEEVAEKFTAVRTDEDEFRVKGREYYWLRRGRTSESTVWADPRIKALRFPRSTMRNLTSLRKLVAKHLSGPG